MNEKICEHEFRQRMKGAGTYEHQSVNDGGYYCIYCLLELDTNEKITEFKKQKE